MRKPIISAGIAMLLAAMTAVAAVAPSAALAAKGHTGTVGHRITANQQQVAAAYWTEPRLKNAKLYRLPRLQATGGPVHRTSAQRTGRAHKLAGRAPAGARVASALRRAP